MIDSSALSRAMVVGTALQVVLAILAYFSGWIAQHALLFGAMMLSAIAGYLYAQRASVVRTRSRPRADASRNQKKTNCKAP